MAYDYLFDLSIDRHRIIKDNKTNLKSKDKKQNKSDLVCLRNVDKLSAAFVANFFDYTLHASLSF